MLQSGTEIAVRLTPSHGSQAALAGYLRASVPLPSVPVNLWQCQHHCPNLPTLRRVLLTSATTKGPKSGPDQHLAVCARTRPRPDSADCVVSSVRRDAVA